MSGVGTVLTLVSVGLQVYSLVRSASNKQRGPRLDGARITDSSYGATIPIGYGTQRLSGNVIWAAAQQEHRHGGKGGGGARTYTYTRDFAVGIAVPGGSDARLLKVFADGALVYDSTGKTPFLQQSIGALRFYSGSLTQEVDPTIEAEVGTADAPAYRGLCYVVHEGFDLTRFGRVPNMSYVVAFEGGDLFPATELTTTADSRGTWIYDRERQKAYLPGFQATPRKVAVVEYDLVADTLRRVESDFPTATWQPEVGNGDFFDGYTQDNAGFLYMAATASTTPALLRFNPDTLEPDQSTTFGGSGDIYALIHYYRPDWSPLSASDIGQTGAKGGNEFVLCCFSDGTFQWVNVEAGLLQVGARFSPVGGNTGAGWGTLDGFQAVTGHIITTQGAFSASISTSRVLNRIQVSQPEIDTTKVPAAATVVYNPGTGGSLPASEMQSVRWLSYDPASDGMLVINDPNNHGVDLPAGNGIARYSLTTWPPLLTAAKSFFVDGEAYAYVGNNRHGLYNLGPINGEFVYHPQKAAVSEIYRIDALTLELIATYDTADYGTYGSSGQITFPGFWDFDRNAWVAQQSFSPQILSLFLDRNATGTQELSAVVADLCLRSGKLAAADFDVTDLTVAADARNVVRGYGLTSRDTIASAISQLMAGYFFDVAEINFALHFRRRAGTLVQTGATLVEADLGVAEDRPGQSWLSLKRVQPFDIPRRFEVRFIDEAADWQISAVPAQMMISPIQLAEQIKQQAIDLPIVFTPDEAKQIAERHLYAAHQENVGLDVDTMPRNLVFDPTDVLAVDADGRSFEVRIEQVEVGENFGVSLRTTVTDAEIFVSTTSVAQSSDGVVAQALAAVVGALLHVMDLVLLRDGDDGGATIPIYLAFSPFAATGWPGGVVYYSSNNALAYQEGPLLTVGAKAGFATTALMPTDRWATWDRTNTVTVSISNGDALASSTEAEVLEGANAAVLGSEVIQFVNATDNGDGTWTLDTLLRGRRGSDFWAEGVADSFAEHAPGERFVLLEETAVRRTAEDLGARGAVRYYKGVTIGNSIASATVRSVPIAANALKPYSGTAPKRVLNGSSDAFVTWLRRTRVGGHVGLAGAPLTGEQALLFEVDLMDALSPSTVATTKTATGTEVKTKGNMSLAINTPSAGKSRITLSGGDFAGDGHIAGALVRLEAFNARNRGPFVVDAVGTTTIDILHTNGATQFPAVSNSIVLQQVEQVKFTAAEQVAAGYTAGDPLVVRIYQMSAAVGRGFVLETTI